MRLLSSFRSALIICVRLIYVDNLGKTLYSNPNKGVLCMRIVVAGDNEVFIDSLAALLNPSGLFFFSEVKKLLPQRLV